MFPEIYEELWGGEVTEGSVPTGRVVNNCSVSAEIFPDKPYHYELNSIRIPASWNHFWPTIKSQPRCLPFLGRFGMWASASSGPPTSRRARPRLYPETSTVETTATPFVFESQQHFSTLQINPSLGEVNWGDVERVGTEVLKKVEDLPNPTVVVDLSQLDYMGSVQVALLVRLWKSIKSRKGRMVVQVTSPIVQEVLKTAGLDKLWDFAETRPEALQVLGVRATAVVVPGMPAGMADYGTSSPVIPGIGLGAILASVGCLIAGRVSSAPVAPGSLPAGGLSTAATIGLVFAGVAVAAGIWTAIKGDMQKRSWGVGIALAGLVIGVVQIVK